MSVMRRTTATYFQRRATLRHEVSARGAVIIKVGEASREIGCRIVDLSLGGAKVELDEDCILPDKVLLFEAHTEHVYECSVRWRSGRTAGLSFLDQVTMSARKALIEQLCEGVVKSMQKEDRG